MTLRSRTTGELGAAAVEFAIILPLLFALIGGIVDFGFAFNAQIGLAHAAREGARHEAIGLGPPDGGTVARNAYHPIGVGAVYTSVAHCPNAAGQASVTISADYEFFILPFGSKLLSSEAVMRCGG